MNYLRYKLPIIFLTAFAFFMVTVAAVFTLHGNTAAQSLEKSTQCGAGIDFNVKGKCSVNDQIEDCKQNTPGNAQEKADACNPESSIEKLIKTILNVFSAIVGSIAVIMVIIGGFRYVTAAGDSNKASSARNTILFAIVGLIIVAFAQIIVRFVLERVITD